MKKLDKRTRVRAKKEFADALCGFADGLREHVSSSDGDWTIKGFIDIYKDIYTISSDTKIVSKILEIHLLPQILELAKCIGYSIVLAERQNWYPDMSFVNKADPRIKFAVDLKTTYRNPKNPERVNGFTLGSHGNYFRNRTGSKNIQFPYSEYSGHFCLGIIYTRVDPARADQLNTVRVEELGRASRKPAVSGRGRVTTVDKLRSITSVISDFQFFVCEKWQLASDHQGSGNTANIGSITLVADILKGNGVFSKLGEKWFDEYWMNYGVATMIKNRKTVYVKNLRDFIKFKGGDRSRIVPMTEKKKKRKDS